MGVDQLVTGGDFDDPVVESLTADSVNTDQINTDWMVDGGSHSDIQSAIDAAEADGISNVFIPPASGLRSENIQVGAGTSVIGALGGFMQEPDSRYEIAAASENDPTVELAGRGSSIIGFGRLDDAGSGNGVDGSVKLIGRNTRIEKCRLRQGLNDSTIFVDSEDSFVLGNYCNSESIILSSNSARCVVDDNTFVSTIVDNGSSNVTGDNS